MKESWLLDLYPGEAGEMVVWLKTRWAEAVKLIDHWTPSLYVAADDEPDLEYLSQRREIQPYIKEWSFDKKIEKITDTEPTKLLKLTVRDARRVEELAKRIEDLASVGFYRIYNADIKPEQSYLYEKNLFPLCLSIVEQINGSLKWSLKDDVWSLDYEIPPLRKIHLAVKVDKTGRIPRLTDPIKQIIISDEYGQSVTVEGGSEVDKLIELTRIIQHFNPDVIFTEDGDSFTLPYLAERAKACDTPLHLSREPIPLRGASRSGTSYFSYGRILFKPSTVRLYGRIHIDKSNTFVIDAAGLEGLYEVSRVCRMPLHTASRASIGKCMSSLQFYYAHQKGVLVPWKPSITEQFKTRLELLTADRGGFIFEPTLGVHENVGELDFTSLYPNIMLKKNLSCETVRCECCPDSTNRVPELDWNICQKRKGIVPVALEILLWKRAQYKKLRKADPARKERHEARHIALKWILLTSFGYLGFNNAKFGRIDAHIAVCAWDRKILIDSARIAERLGYHVMHGIVDSLWLKKEKIGEEDYLALTEEVTKETGFTINFEGIYKWIAFLPSKVYSGTPVINRYFGAFRNGEVKIRGLEARRSDTPPCLSRCQMELITLLSKADSVQEVKRLIPECKELFRRYALHLHRKEVPARDLFITRNLSKEHYEYVNRNLESIVAKQLAREGLPLHRGQSIRYLITDYYSKQPNRRALAEQLIDEHTTYDVKRYIELLAEVCASILEPFGCSRTELVNTLLLQTSLHP